jgi:hypothetical protein
MPLVHPVGFRGTGMAPPPARTTPIALMAGGRMAWRLSAARLVRECTWHTMGLRRGDGRGPDGTQPARPSPARRRGCHRAPTRRCRRKGRVRPASRTSGSHPLSSPIRLLRRCRAVSPFISAIAGSEPREPAGSRLDVLTEGDRWPAPHRERPPVSRARAPRTGGRTDRPGGRSGTARSCRPSR